MKFKKTLLAVSLMMGITSFANAADQGHGTVTFHGNIIDAPCSLAGDSVDQKIEMGQISNVELENGGSSTPKPFDIQLENCSTATLKSVTATFTGAAGANGNLGITGDAKGASIVLTDGAGTKIELGKATAAQTLQDGNNTLAFSAYLQGDGASAAIVPGEFTGITDFTLAYQ
ncbi:fimbrial protein [Enterobacter cancerogenus]|uniref:Fimbrial protein n=1 Tax=Enterobacter cancerogenus TaxID=69218 RepID=A0A484WWT2_9ENTR|nr:fimbrial protein [Enterobacter cancerogenus]HDX4396459.1 type 1 fimbrial protein [Enterobacter bugandensis]